MNAKKNRPSSTKGGRPHSTPAKSKPMIATRVEPALYEQIAEAAAKNHCSVSSEAEKRLKQSFDTLLVLPDDDLQDFTRDLMLSFKAGGLRMSQSLGMKAVSEAGPPACEWLTDPLSYTEAASRALEAIADYHPKPTYGYCLLMIYAFRVRLNLRWHALLNEADEEERKKLLEHADAMAREMTLPNLLDPLPKLRSEKDED